MSSDGGRAGGRGLLGQLLELVRALPFTHSDNRQFDPVGRQATRFCGVQNVTFWDSGAVTVQLSCHRLLFRSVAEFEAALERQHGELAIAALDLAERAALDPAEVAA